MASIFSHAIAAAALAPVVLPRPIPGRVVVLGALAAILPDADVIGFRFGVAYGYLLGHRGLTHSLAFALLLAALLLPFAGAGSRMSRGRVFAYLALAAASHGVLDAFTNGGLGVAFFAPFSPERYFFPVRPIQVSPIGAAAFFSERGRRVIASELLWIWLPAAAVAGLAWMWKKGKIKTES
jgi:inner membrane protein